MVNAVEELKERFDPVYKANPFFCGAGDGYHFDEDNLLGLRTRDSEKNIYFVRYDVERLDFDALFLRLRKNGKGVISMQEDFPNLPYTGSLSFRTNESIRISKLLTFKKRKTESNAELILRISDHARDYVHGGDCCRRERKVDLVEFLNFNLNKPLNVFYHNLNYS